MSTTTNVEQVKINVMTQQQYNAAVKNPTELYMITDAALDVNEIPSIPLSKISDVTATVTEVNYLSGTTGAVQTQFNNITDLIPAAASSSNELADKAFVNSSITSLAAYYVTSDVNGNTFATYAALAAGPYYHDGASYTPSQNDYAIVTTDETQSNATTRYAYTGSRWSFQYKVNDTPFTQAQLNAINSGITSDLVSDYDSHLENTTIHVTSSDKTTWSGKQDALVSGTNIKTINNNSLLGSGDITIDSLPSQAGQSGKYLTTNGTTASWATTPTEVEWAVQNSTTLSQIKAWYDAGKDVKVKIGGVIYGLISCNSSDAYFSNTNGNKNSSNVMQYGISIQHVGFSGWDWLVSGSIQSKLVSGTDIKTINNTSLLGSGNININGLPSQSSQSGKFLTTNGTTASWANIPTEIPTQTGNNGKFLTTDGSDVSWATVDALPSQTSQSGKFLTTDGTTASWANVDALPSQTSQSGKFLTTNGTTASWAEVPTSLPSQSGNNGKFLSTNGTTASWTTVATVATSGSYNDLSNKLTAGTDISISNSNVISSTHPEVYLTQSEYDNMKSAGTLDPNTYYNTSTSTPFSVDDFISIRSSMNPGDILNRGYMVLVPVS